jgi:hypothetical protein
MNRKRATSDKVEGVDRLTLPAGARIGPLGFRMYGLS